MNDTKESLKMSQGGFVCFYLETPRDARTLVQAGLSAALATQARSVTRWADLDKEWEKFRAAITQSDEEEEGEHQWISYAGGPYSEEVATDAGVEAIVAAFRPGTALRISPETELWRVIWDSVVSTVPESVRGGFIPSGVSFQVGWHDIFECAENDEGHLFGTAFFSFTLEGATSPNDWATCREMLQQVPEIRALKQRLEAQLGELKTAIYWYV